MAYRFYANAPEKGYDIQNGWVPLNALALFEVVNGQVHWDNGVKGAVQRIALEDLGLGVADSAPWDLFKQAAFAAGRLWHAGEACDEYKRTTYDGGFCEEEADRLEAAYNACFAIYKGIAQKLEDIPLSLVGDVLTPTGEK